MIRKKELTKKQHQLMSFLRETVRERKEWPTLSEMQHHFGYKSLNSISQLLEALVNKHYLKKGNRRYFFKDQIDAPIQVPLYANNSLGSNRSIQMRPIWRDLDGLKAIEIHQQNEGFLGLNRGDFLLVSDTGVRAGRHIVYRYNAETHIGKYGGSNPTIVRIDGAQLPAEKTTVLGRYCGWIQNVHVNPSGADNLAIKHQAVYLVDEMNRSIFVD